MDFPEKTTLVWTTIYAIFTGDAAIELTVKMKLSTLEHINTSNIALIKNKIPS